MIPANAASARGAKLFEPDFAYPKTVAADAEAIIASPSTPSPERLRAVLARIRALTDIDPENRFSAPAYLAERAGDAARAGDANARSLYILLEASVLKDIYSDNSWKYNRVDAPLEPYPADVSEWSGLQFRTRISRLLAEADSLSDAAPSLPLLAYDAAVTCEGEARRYFPALRDFVLVKSFNILRQAGLPDEADTLARKVLSLSVPGSDSWAYWTVEVADRASDRAETLLRAYEDHSQSEAARYILMSLSRLGAIESEESTDAQLLRWKSRRISLLRESLERFPDWWGNAVLKNNLGQLTLPVVSLSFPSAVGVGQSVSVVATASFAESAGYVVARIPAGYKGSVSNRNLKNFTEVCRASRPASADSISLAVDLPPVVLDTPGEYVVCAVINGSTRSSGFMMRFNVYPFMPLVLNGSECGAVLTADMATGAPVAGVTVTDVARRDNGRLRRARLGLTDAGGILPFAKSALVSDARAWDKYLSFAYKGRTYDFGSYFRAYASGGDKGDPQGRASAIMMTDRPVYHRGDSVEWAVILYEAVAGRKWQDSKTLEGRRLRVEMHDANGQLVDSAFVRTDAFGRACGAFASRSECLSGSYSLSARLAGKDNESMLYLGGTSVIVSDFALPSFEAEITSVERDVPAPGAVRLKGVAATYSGMPVAGATVSANVSGAYRWRWWSAGTYLGTVSDSRPTDAAGAFVIDIPASMLKDKDFSDFVAEISVTSPTGEAVDVRKVFTTGKPYVLLTSDMPDRINIAAPPALTVKAINADGGEKALPLAWQMLDGDSVAASGTGMSGTPLPIDFAALRAGYYRLSVAPADSALADKILSEPVALFDLAKNALPASAPLLFMPSDKPYRISPDGRSAEVTFGVNAPKAFVYTASAHAGRMEGPQIKELSRGFHSFKLPLGEDAAYTRVFIASLSEGRWITRSIDIPAPDRRKTRIKVETFRDRVTPGAVETWRFRLYDASADSVLTSSAMVATMYNHAIDALGASFSWPASFRISAPRTMLSLGTLNPYNSRVEASMDFRRAKETGFSVPSFVFVSNGLRIRGTKLYKTMARSVATSDMSESVVMEEEMAYDVAAPAAGVAVENGMLFGARSMADGGAAVEESADDSEEKAQDLTGDAEEAPREFEYRDSEVLQAFWQPSLVAAPDGSVDVCFTVPNAVTTWAFHSFAWTPGLRAAANSATCVASKPIMVQPQLPRFLRRGDKARVLATVYNKTDSVATDVRTVVELFIPSDGSVIATFESSDTIAPGASAIVAADITTPEGTPAVGYRVRSSSGAFSDGEQALIPILASAATVVESTQFYLDPGASDPFTLVVPAASEPVTLTLQYCRNPVWTIVKAMRGLSTGNSFSSSSAVSALFSCLAASHIAAENPAIAEAIEEWKANPSQEALVSMLARNEELKTLVLGQTPWVQAAADNSARMAQLAMIFDRSAVSKAVARNVELLRKLQNSDGGFKWGAWSRESSRWATEEVLTTLGIARSLGFLPRTKDFDSMISRAIAYVDASLAADKYAKTDLGYTFILALFPDHKPAALRTKQIVERTVADVVAGWKKTDAVAKAYAIIIMRAYGYEAVAETAARSLLQFGVTSPGTGMSFPSVSDIRGYATIIQALAASKAATRADIDAMRQWILVRAQALDDLGAHNPDYVIAAVMLTGTDWTASPAASAGAVIVNGRPLELTKQESATGYFSQTLQGDGLTPTAVTVTPGGKAPSYGSVISIGRRPAASVKARPGKDLKIEKRFLVQQPDGSWTETASTASLALGTRVRVQLIVKASRDLKYVAVTDERAACFEPVDQLPGYVYDGGLAFYRENNDASTNLFIDFLPSGTYHLSYDMTASTAGSFVSGIATIQSQYAPEITAHSAGRTLRVE